MHMSLGYGNVPEALVTWEPEPGRYLEPRNLKRNHVTQPNFVSNKN